MHIRGTSRMSKKILYILGIFAVILSYGFYHLLDYGLIRSITSSLPLVWILWLAWDQLIWKIFAGARGMPPLISGLWTGKLKSSYDENVEINITFAIKQTFSNVFLEAKTENNSSYSICAKWISSPLQPRLFYLYQTKPLGGQFSKDNMPQYGGGCLYFETINTLTINYWTTSGTIGIITLQKMLS